MSEKQSKALERVTIRFAGDSGDGMQLTGGQFTITSALAGNDLIRFRIIRQKFAHRPVRYMVFPDFKYNLAVARFIRPEMNLTF